MHIIWWIDDDLGIRYSVESVVASEERRIVTFGSLQELLGFSERHQNELPHVVCTDLRLRNESGHEVIVAVRRICVARIVIVSGAEEAPIVGKKFGVPVVPKPLSVQKILQAVSLGLGGEQP